MSLPLFAIVTFVTSDDTSLGTFRVPMTSETTVRRLAKDAMQRLVLSRRGNDCTLAAYQPLKISEVYVLCNLVGNAPQRAEVFASDLVINVVSVREEVIYMTLQNSTPSTTAAQVNKELEEVHSSSTSTNSTQDILWSHKENNAKYNSNMMMPSNCSETEQSVNRVTTSVNEAANISGEHLSNAHVSTHHNLQTSSLSLSPSTSSKKDALAPSAKKARTNEVPLSKTATVEAITDISKAEESADVKVPNNTQKSNKADESKENRLPVTITSSISSNVHSVNNVKSNKTNTTTSNNKSQNKCNDDKKLIHKEPEQKGQRETNSRKRQRNCEGDNNHSSKTDNNIESSNNISSATKRIRICRIELDAESEERIRKLREREMARTKWPKSSYHNKHYADNYVSSPDKLMRRPSKKIKSSTKHDTQETATKKHATCSADVGGKPSSIKTSTHSKEERHVTFSAEHDSKTRVETSSTTSTISSPAFHEERQQHTVDVDEDDMDSNNSSNDDKGNKVQHVNCNDDDDVHLRPVSVSSYFVNSPQPLILSSSSSSSNSELRKEITTNQMVSSEINSSNITQDGKCVAGVSGVEKNDQCVDVVCDVGKAISRKIAVARQLLFSQIDCTNESTPTGRSTMAHVVQSFDEDKDVEHNVNDKESSKVNNNSHQDIAIHKDAKCAEKETVNKEENKVLKMSKDFARQRSPEQPHDKKSLGWGWNACKFFDPETYCDDPSKAHLILKNRKKKNDAAVT